MLCIRQQNVEYNIFLKKKKKHIDKQLIKLLIISKSKILLNMVQWF